MGLCNSPDIFQEKMSELMDGLAFVWTYIDDLLSLTKGSFSGHLKKVELVLQRLQKAGLKVNATTSFFAHSQLEHLGYWITRTGIKPVCNTVKVVLKIAEPKNRKELQSFIGVVNYHERHVGQTVPCSSSVLLQHWPPKQLSGSGSLSIGRCLQWLRESLQRKCY